MMSMIDDGRVVNYRGAMKWLLLGALVVGGCGGSSTSGDDVGAEADASTMLQPSEACEKYLSCVLVATPQSYAAQLALYGSSSECWKTPQQSANCGQACTASFADIANKCTCVGTHCEPAMPMPTCTDANEPNEDLQHAMPVGTSADGAVCPATDVDLFSISIGNVTLTVNVTYASGGPLALAILNSGGVPIANGSPQTGGVRAQVPNLPSGIYYVKITGSAKADYHLAITTQ
jgi:hypothetical protein